MSARSVSTILMILNVSVNKFLTNATACPPHWNQTAWVISTDSWKL